MNFPAAVFCGLPYRSLNVYKSILRKIDFGKNIKFHVENSTIRSSRTISSFPKGQHTTFTCNIQYDNYSKLNVQRVDFISTKAQNEQPKNIGTHVKSAKAALKKIKRKNTISQKSKGQIKPGRDSWSVVGYSTAESYDLYNLARRLAVQDLYDPVYLGHELAPLCLCVTSKYNFENENDSKENESNSKSNDQMNENNAHELTQPIRKKDIFFFADGSVVFWSVPELERKTVLDFLRHNPGIEEPDGKHDQETIFEESEMMNYFYSTDQNENENTSVKVSQLDKKGHIRLIPKYDPSEHYLEKYAFSNSIAASVKLGTIEAQLDRIIDSIEFLSEDMKLGRELRVSRSEMLMKTGEIFALRHVLNLSSDLLDTPDFYWDRAKLEMMYHETCAHLAVRKRISVTNEKMNHCCELLDLVTNNLNDHHHTKLEWYIIILIMIEVFFELWHFIERYLT